MKVIENNWILNTYKNVLFIIMMALTCPFIIYKIQGGFDNSWIYFLNIANLNEYIFGKDVFFTYGPLGYLMWTLNIGNNVIISFVFWSFIYLINVFLLIKIYYYSNIDIHLIGISLILYSLTMPEGDYYLCYLLILTIGLMWKSKENKKIIYITIILLEILLFMKFSAAILGLATLIVFCICFFITDLQLAKYYLIRVIGGLILFPFIYFIYNHSIGDFIQYVKYAFDISSGYNIALSFPKTNIYFIFVFLIAVMFLMIILLLFKIELKLSLYILLFMPALFLLYKHGFIRADYTHLAHTVNGLLWVTSVIILFLDWNKILEKNQKIFQIIVVLFFIIASIPTIYMSKSIDSIITEVKNRTIDVPKNIQDIRLYPSDNSLIGLPEVFINKIGNNKMSIYPSEISYVATNKNLNFVPMPLIQVCTAYTPDMDIKNSEFFAGNDAPEYIIFSLNTIDGRIALIEAPKTWQMIYNNYSVDDKADNLFLLKKNKKEESQFNKIQVNEYSQKNTELINVDNGTDYIELDLNLNIIGRITKLLWKIPVVTINIEYDDGVKRAGRTVPENLSNGIFIDKVPYDENTFINIMNKNNEKKRIKNISFSGDGLKYYKNINVREFKIDFEEKALE